MTTLDTMPASVETAGQSMVTLGTFLQWTDSEHPIANGLIKIQKQDTLKRFLVSGCCASNTREHS